MLGRLFARGATAPVEGEDQNPAIPTSYLEESETRNLIYRLPIAPIAETRLDPNKDMRVALIVDHPQCEAVVFDSATYQEMPAPSHPSPENMPYLERLSGGLTRSFSSLSLTSSGDSSSKTPSPLGQRQSFNGLNSHQQTPRHASNPTPVSAVSAYQTHYKDLPEPLSLPLLKQVVFGYTPLVIKKPITKLHLLPDNKSGRKTFLISLLFKVKVPTDQPLTVFTHRRREGSEMRFPGGPSSLARSEFSTPASENDALVWNPDGIFFPQKDDAANFYKEVRCGLCIYFSPPRENPDALVNHWEDVVHALLELQASVSKRIVEFLSSIDEAKESVAPVTKKGLARRFSLISDVSLVRSTEKFRYRVYKGLRIPRVVCGQDRWNELYRELKWAMHRFDDVEAGVSFLASLIAFFVDLSRGLLAGNFQIGKSPPVRTVLVANNRVYARKLIFILSSLIHDGSSAKLVQQGIFDEQNSSDIYRCDSRAMTVNGDSTSIAGSLSAESFISLNRISSLESQGWDISSNSCQTEFSTAQAIPYMVKPAASPTHLLSRSLARSYSRSRLPSLDNIYRSVTSTGSLFSSGASEFAGSPGSSVFDEDLVDHPHYSEDGSFSMTKDYTQEHGIERTVDLISRNGITRGSNADPPSSPLYSVYSNDEGVLDVKIEDLEFYEDDDSPIVLPPVAGHVQEFHSDYLVQAVPNYRELEDNITKTMALDAREWGSGRSLDGTLSSTMIIHLRNRELYEWKLIEQGEQGEPTVPRLFKKKLYSSRLQSEQSLNHCRSVETQLRDIISSNQEHHPTELQLETLKTAFWSCFGLVV